jgi:peptidoglycan biosynthesis protein MviN/MurJ (putative lipid II flippase)
MGPEFHESATVLRILLVGLSAEISALMLGGALYATGRLRALTVSNLAEALVIVVMAYLLARPFGVKGVAFAVSFALVANKVVAQPLILLGILGIPLRDWVTKVIWRPAIAAFVGGWLVWISRSLWPADTILEVIAHLAFGGLLLIAIGWFLVFEPEERGRLLAPFRRADGGTGS